MTDRTETRRVTPLDDRGRGVRERLAVRLRGEGLEIGALAHPIRLDPTRARARYVDCLDLQGLRKNYPELKEERIVTPDHVIPGERLKGIPRGSQDFVVASHVLEHLEDPLGALAGWHRHLRPGGLLYLAVPDKRFTRDRERPRTTLAHLVRDHRDGGAGSRVDHVKAFGQAHLGLETEEELRGFLKRVNDIDYKVHFHVWIPDDVQEILQHMGKKMNLPWKLEEMVETDHEVILLARKAARKGAA